jgi:hypothetical protein
MKTPIATDQHFLTELFREGATFKNVLNVTSKLFNRQIVQYALHVFERTKSKPTNQAMKNLNSFIFFLFLTLHLTAQTPRQVLDLVPGTASTFNDVQDELKIGVGNRVLFVVYQMAQKSQQFLDNNYKI